MRDRLIELLKGAETKVIEELSRPLALEEWLGVYADHLLANGVTVQEWISVKDGLPENDLPKDTKKKMIRCLVYTDKGTVKPCVRQRWEHFDGKMQPWMWNKDLFAKPTHWMYYPQPPKGE